MSEQGLSQQGKTSPGDGRVASTESKTTGLAPVDQNPLRTVRHLFHQYSVSWGYL